MDDGGKVERLMKLMAERLMAGRSADGVIVFVSDGRKVGRSIEVGVVDGRKVERLVKLMVERLMAVRSAGGVIVFFR